MRVEPGRRTAVVQYNVDERLEACGSRVTLPGDEERQGDVGRLQQTISSAVGRTDEQEQAAGQGGQCIGTIEKSLDHFTETQDSSIHGNEQQKATMKIAVSAP